MQNLTRVFTTIAWFVLSGGVLAIGIAIGLAVVEAAAWRRSRRRRAPDPPPPSKCLRNVFSTSRELSSATKEP